MIPQSAGFAPFLRSAAVIAIVIAFTLVTGVEQSAAQVQHFNVSGTVESVSYASNTVHINASGQTVDVVITPTTVIEYHGETGSVGNIRRGSKITASGVVRDGQKVALSIVIK
jgi:hypothetical protein